MAQDLLNIRRVAFVGHDNSGSRHILSEIMRTFPEIQATVVLAVGLYYRQSLARSILRMLLGSSIQFCAARAFEMFCHRLSGKTVRRYCEEHGIPIFVAADINRADCVAYLREFGPDLIVSLYTMQLYKRPILDVPRLGAISSHPSILPEYRGLEVFFWQMVNDEPASGVSVFYLSEKIDQGAILKQRIVPIEKTETMEDVYRKVTAVAARLLCETISEIDAGVAKVQTTTGNGSYYGMPTRAAMRRFRRAKKRMFVRARRGSMPLD